jgi:hypothetical protein
MARSSAKMNYRAMASIANELMWIKQLLRDLDSKLTNQCKYFAIIKPQDTSFRIRYFTKELNILKLIVTLFGRRYKQTGLKPLM